MGGRGGGRGAEGAIRAPPTPDRMWLTCSGAHGAGQYGVGVAACRGGVRLVLCSFVKLTRPRRALRSRRFGMTHPPSLFFFLTSVNSRQVDHAGSGVPPSGKPARSSADGIARPASSGPLELSRRRTAAARKHRPAHAPLTCCRVPSHPPFAAAPFFPSPPRSPRPLLFFCSSPRPPRSPPLPLPPVAARGARGWAGRHVPPPPPSRGSAWGYHAPP